MKIKKNILFAVTVLVLIFYMIPFFILVINTFKSTPEFIKTPFALPKSLSLDNFATAIERMNFWTTLKNTALLFNSTQFIQYITKIALEKALFLHICRLFICNLTIFFPFYIMSSSKDKCSLLMKPQKRRHYGYF